MKNKRVLLFKDVSKTFMIKDKDSDSIMKKVINFFRPQSYRKIFALKNISFIIHEREVLGIVGRNGSGKSTLLKLINGAYPPDSGGLIQTSGKIIRLSLGMGFDPNLTARENIYLNGSILGLSFKKIGSKFDSIISFSGLTDFIDTQVKYYSSGMVSRLAFAIAIHAEANIFLLDEFWGGVGDIDFRSKSDKAFHSLLLDKTIVMVSHDLNQIRKYCDRLIVLNHGAKVFEGNVEKGIELYNSLYSNS